MIEQKLTSLPELGDAPAENHMAHSYRVPPAAVHFEFAEIAPGAAATIEVPELRHPFAKSSLVRNGLPAMIGAFAAAATAGLAALPALGLSVLTGLGFTWLNSHNRPS
ncbi:hypothetical protein [Sphingopyxis sp. USTB-05]|uniref:hypothetical protein n=1 Tax=Sphingopyxis sp. USTB-05 TaxID=2830667 RepID=UPI0020787666|nr:hypothetical protein [Sphingopyxis sp. USTB-05]USI78601.1 hypothetical protein KEC45_06825 [Sphingopyxis sp. USTB-05]